MHQNPSFFMHAQNSTQSLTVDGVLQYTQNLCPLCMQRVHYFGQRYSYYQLLSRITEHAQKTKIFSIIEYINCFKREFND